MRLITTVALALSLATAASANCPCSLGTPAAGFLATNYASTLYSEGRYLKGTATGSILHWVYDRADGAPVYVIGSYGGTLPAMTLPVYTKMSYAAQKAKAYAANHNSFVAPLGNTATGKAAGYRVYEMGRPATYARDFIAINGNDGSGPSARSINDSLHKSFPAHSVMSRKANAARQANVGP